MMRLPPFYVAMGVVAMLVLGQAAVLVPGASCFQRAADRGGPVGLSFEVGRAV